MFSAGRPSLPAGGSYISFTTDGMEWLRELIRGRSATSLNTGEHVTSSRGGYYSNNFHTEIAAYEHHYRIRTQTKLGDKIFQEYKSSSVL